jgi:glucokinase
MIYLGIDIGGTNLKAGLVDDSGKIVDSQSSATPTNLDDFSLGLRQLISNLLQKTDVISGVGIGCKGIINPVTTEVVTCPGTFKFLEGHRLADFIEGLFPPNIPIIADNDARVALVGEVVWGAAKNAQNALMLTLGTGVGGAILAEGKIVRGQSGVAGHLGHITIEPNGEMCICGNRGCLETVFSARAIEAAALSAIHRGCESILTTQFATNYEKLTCLDVFTAANAGDLMAKSIVNEAIRRLGAAIAGLFHIFDPELIIIGGQIAEAGDALFIPLNKEISWRIKGLIKHPARIVLPKISDKAGIVGAVALLVQM